ncbi:hypothetical protein SNE40_018297 [Patella caerulea]|uniref:Uncharacterized protein n=1 Tax=Patella caerulea TaxID=87958 RepID=A0AAN8JBI9_PATCE
MYSDNDSDHVLLDPVIPEVVSTNEQMHVPIDSLIMALKNKAVLSAISNALATVLMPQIHEEIKATVQHLGMKVKVLEHKVSEKEREIDILKEKVDELEQYSRREAIRISGIEERDGESTDELVVKVGKLVGVDIQASDINRSHRVGHPSNYKDEPRPIIVRFRGYYTKKSFVKGRGRLKQIATKVKLTTSQRTNKSSDNNDTTNHNDDFDLESVPLEMRRNPVYINDDLTQKRSKLAAIARRLFKEGKIQGTWVADGIIFVKK